MKALLKTNKRRIITWAGIIIVYLAVIAAVDPVKTVRETQGREGPGSFYKLVKLIPKNISLEVIEQKRSWYKVNYIKEDVWISGNSLDIAAINKSTGSDKIIGGNPFTQASAEASSAVLTGAIKGFWTRYSGTLNKELYELPIEGYDVPLSSYERFNDNRAKAVSRESLMRKYSLPGKFVRKEIPYEREHSIGYACASAVADAPLIDNERLINYVHSVAWYIAECTDGYDIPFKIYILNTELINAISCPGGYIVLTRGLLSMLENEAELAALLAHEMAHVIAGHGMLEVMENNIQTMASSVFDVLDNETGGASSMEMELDAIANRAVSIANSPKLDKYEFEADMMAMRYMARSGYDLNGLFALLVKMKHRHDQSVDMFDMNYRNHPDFDLRIKRLEDESRKYRGYNGNTFASDFEKNMLF